MGHRKDRQELSKIYDTDSYGWITINNRTLSLLIVFLLQGISLGFYAVWYQIKRWRRYRSVQPDGHSLDADPEPTSQAEGPQPEQTGGDSSTPQTSVSSSDASQGTPSHGSATNGTTDETPSNGAATLVGDTGNRNTVHVAAGDEIPSPPDVSVEYQRLTEQQPIGSGGNADVTRAKLPTEDGDVTLAVKEPRISGTFHTDTIERLLTEAETWDKLDDHDHIVNIVDYGSEPLPWIAMEYMDGGHLGDRTENMPIEQKLWVAIAITKGVRHAHRRGVAHLDLKPESVLFRTMDEAWDVPKVGDWGLSKHLLEHSASVEGLSPHYAAPEQFDDDYGPADDITDIYQLGAVFYELFTGRPPYEGKPTEVMRAVLDDDPTPPSELSNVPEELDEVILTALSTSKDERYDNVSYLRDALQDVFEDQH